MQASQAQNETRLPRAVLRRSAAIEARIAKRDETETSPAPDTPPAPPSATAATPADPNPAPPAPPEDPRENDPAYWKQRFNVTAGVLRRERDERVAEGQRFNQQLTEMQDQIRVLQATAPAAEVDLKQFLKPEQIEALGEDDAATIVQTAIKAAKAEVQKALDAEIKPLREQRAAEQTQAAADRKAEFKDKLTEFVPDYETIDVSDGWLEWLAQEDEATGVQRQMLLDTHVGRLDAAKVAKLFRAYKAETARPSPPVAPQGNGAVPDGTPPQPDASALRAPSDRDVRDYFRRAALGQVKDKERKEFEARLKLRAGR